MDTDATLITTDPQTFKLIEGYIKTFDLALGVTYEAAEKESPFILIGAQKLSKPVRMGAMLHAITKDQRTNQKSSDFGVLEFNGGVLNLDTGLFTRGGEPDARLTEKEITILKYLHERKGDAVSRQELLTAVWSYAENVETHTLETHIYRLRQKIEKNPSEPQTLLTLESGYIVC